MQRRSEMLDTQAVAHIEEVLGYRFREKALLVQAFIRESYCNEARQAGRPVQSNEVLEFCGDSVLGLSVVTLLMRRFAACGERGLETRLDQGDLTAVKSNLTDKHMLSERMRELGLGKYLLTSVGDRKVGATEERSVLEDLFESLVGAVYLDSGCDLPCTVEMVGRLLDIDRFLIRKKEGRASISPKNDVQEWCDPRGLRFGYEVRTVSGPDNDRFYEVVCAVEGIGEATGSGRSKKEAEKAAAAAILPLLHTAEDQTDRTDAAQENGKTRLQKWCAAHKKDCVYTQLTPHPEGKRFRCLCTVAGLSAEGEGNNKKEAEKAAATALLLKLEG